MPAMERRQNRVYFRGRIIPSASEGRSALTDEPMTIDSSLAEPSCGRWDLSAGIQREHMRGHGRWERSAHTARRPVWITVTDSVRAESSMGGLQAYKVGAQCGCTHKAPINLQKPKSLKP